jgi:hypothetical protein
VTGYVRIRLMLWGWCDHSRLLHLHSFLSSTVSKHKSTDRPAHITDKYWSLFDLFIEIFNNQCIWVQLWSKWLPCYCIILCSTRSSCWWFKGLCDSTVIYSQREIFIKGLRLCRSSQNFSCYSCRNWRHFPQINAYNHHIIPMIYVRHVNAGVCLYVLL